MGNIAIKAEHLSKMYKLGVINNGTLWKDIQTWAALKMGKEDPHSRIGEDKYSGDDDHFWALKDIDFEIQQGDRVGIIGKNGAGKSTLLKILSRVTAPTEGTIKIKGKIASLLEVGTGFNGELTGRENIYLNGAILGMKKRQIDRKIDEIIDFSEIEHHIDTPVKRYSSGMYVRLAFAVAAHLDSEILIADEVLAVGDAAFQKKALGKMNDLSTGQGRTVLFVSHNMGAVKSLCNKGVILDKGRIRYNSNDILEVLTNYYSFFSTAKQNCEKRCFWETESQTELQDFRITEFCLSRSKCFVPIAGSITNDQNYFFIINCEIQKEIGFSIRFGIVVFAEDNSVVFTSEIFDHDFELQEKITEGEYVAVMMLPSHFLNEGKYRAEITATSPLVGWIFHPGVTINPTVFFEIEGGLSDSPIWTSKRAGYTAPVLKWEINKINNCSGENNG